MESTEQEVRERFKKIRQKATKLGLSGEDLGDLECIQNLRVQRKSKIKPWASFICYWGTVFGLVGVVCLAVQWPVSRERLVDSWYQFYGQDMYKEPCMFYVPESVVDYVRPPVNCKICKGVKSVDRVEKLSQTVFEANYAYTGLPVVITDGAKNWTATETFSFEFFKSIYGKDSPVLTHSESSCQFFPYKTNFGSIAEVFNMSQDRAQFKEGTQPWYVGW